MAYVQHTFILKTGFDIRFYVFPTIAVLAISFLMARIKKITQAKEDKEHQKEIQLAQQIHHTKYFIEKFAHDFRTHLLKLNLNFERAIDLYDTEELAKLKQKQKENLNAATESVTQLTDMMVAKSDDVDEVNLKDILLEIEQIIKTVTKDRTALTIDIYSYKSIHAIPSQIYQLFLNLCFNSLYALGNKNDSKISIKIACDEEDKSQALKQISDNRERLNEIDFTTDPDSHAHELSLSYSKAIVDKHHGSMISKVDDLGNFCFNIKLPYEFSGDIDHA